MNTLQKWDRKGLLSAYRSPTNRRYDTHEQYLPYRGLISSEQGVVIVYALVTVFSARLHGLSFHKNLMRAAVFGMEGNDDQSS